MKLFADSSFFIAYYNQTDQYHLQAVNLTRRLSREINEVITTDYVYDESVSFLLESHTKFGYQRALRFTKNVLDSGKFTLIHIAETVFAEARKIFELYNEDKRWSFTDCTSFALMKDFAIKDVLTFDHHFAEMGFSLFSVDKLPGSSRVRSSRQR